MKSKGASENSHELYNFVLVYVRPQNVKKGVDDARDRGVRITYIGMFVLNRHKRDTFNEIRFP